MKKVGDTFERVSWDPALDEIAEKLKTILAVHGPRSLALMGGDWRELPTTASTLAATKQ